MNFKTTNQTILRTTNLNEFYENTIRKIEREMSEFERKGSGWSLNSVINLELRINNFNPLSGSSYIDLPKEIKDKKAVINVKNEDQECFNLGY